MKLRVFSSLLLLFFAAYQLAAQAVSVGAAGALSFGVGSSLGVASVIVQESVPDAFRGRVMSFYGLSFTGVMPFAALAVARIADVVGMRRELLFAAVAYCMSGMLLMPVLRRTNPETHSLASIAEHLVKDQALDIDNSDCCLTGNSEVIRARSRLRGDRR